MPIKIRKLNDGEFILATQKGVVLSEPLKTKKQALAMRKQIRGKK